MSRDVPPILPDFIDPDDLAVLGNAECPGCGHIGDHATGCALGPWNYDAGKVQVRNDGRWLGPGPAGALYHGGAVGLNLQVGDLILPPASTGATSLDVYASPMDKGTTRLDRVYMVEVEQLASMWAGVRRSPPALKARRGIGGDVFRVEPVGQVEPDPDYHAPPGEPCLSWQAESAVIVQVVRRRVPLSFGLALIGEPRHSRWFR